MQKWDVGSLITRNWLAFIANACLKWYDPLQVTFQQINLMDDCYVFTFIYINIINYPFYKFVCVPNSSGAELLPLSAIISEKEWDCLPACTDLISSLP